VFTRNALIKVRRFHRHSPVTHVSHCRWRWSIEVTRLKASLQSVRCVRSYGSNPTVAVVRLSWKPLRYTALVQSCTSHPKSLSTLSQKSATICRRKVCAEFRRCLAVFGDSRTFLRQCGQGLTEADFGTFSMFRPTGLATDCLITVSSVRCCTAPL